MAQYVLSCCSTADLTPEHFAERDIHWFPFHFFMDEKEYLDDLGQSMDYTDFYRKMAEGADTRTAQVNSEEFVEGFEKFLQEGKDVLHVTLSSGLSGVYNSACIARDLLMEKYPDRKIIIIDSLGASSGYGLLMDKLADLRDEGYTLEELAEWAEEHKLDVHHWFFSTDLSFYVKGGRISKAAGWLGTILRICPLLNMDCQGKLIPRYKVRGKKAVINMIVDKMAAHADKGLNYDGKVYISMSACEEDARAVADLVEKRFKKMKGKVEINNVGTTIGSHTGPGTVALFFFGDSRSSDPESASPEKN